MLNFSIFSREPDRSYSPLKRRSESPSLDHCLQDQGKRHDIIHREQGRHHKTNCDFLSGSEMEGQGDIVMVTGGSGFLGQHIVKLLQEKADTVKEIRVFDIIPYVNKLGESIHDINLINCKWTFILHVYCNSIIRHHGHDKKVSVLVAINIMLNVLTMCRLVLFGKNYVSYS